MGNSCALREIISRNLTRDWLRPPRVVFANVPMSEEEDSEEAEWEELDASQREGKAAAWRYTV